MTRIREYALPGGSVVTIGAAARQYDVFGEGVVDIPAAGPVDLILDFENNNLSGFDELDGTQITVAGAAALEGSYGLQVDVTGTDQHEGTRFFRDGTETVYHAYLRFDQNTLTATSTGTSIPVMRLSTNPARDLIVSLRWRVDLAGDDTVRVLFRDDAGTNHAANGSSNLTDAPHQIEMEITRASSAVAADASLVLWADANELIRIENIDLYDVWPPAVLEAGAYENSSAYSGIMYLDEIRVREGSEFIGPQPAVISGDVTIDLTIAAAMQHTVGFSIDGAVTVGTTIGAELLFEAVLSGDVSVGISIASAALYTPQGRIDGDVPVVVVPAATALEFTIALIGAVTVQISPLSAFAYRGAWSKVAAQESTWTRQDEATAAWSRASEAASGWQRLS